MKYTKVFRLLFFKGGAKQKSKSALAPQAYFYHLLPISISNFMI